MGELQYDSLLQKLIANADNISQSYSCGKGTHWYLISVLACICGECDFSFDEETKQEIEKILHSYSAEMAQDPSKVKQDLIETYEKKGASHYDERAFKDVMRRANEKAQKEGCYYLSATQFLEQVLADADNELKRTIGVNQQSSKPQEEKKPAPEAQAQGTGDSGEGEFSEDSTAPTVPASETPERKKKAIGELTAFVKQLQCALSQEVLGQENAIDIVTSGYFHAELQAMTEKDRKKPKATFLFAGPPGVGKTLLADTFAQKLGMEPKIFDMSSYSGNDAITSLLGSENVYKNADSGDLTGFLSKHPKSVIVFDEIEKAHLTVIHLFLQILEGRKIKDLKTDEELSFKDAIIIFTTNAGKQLYEGTDQTDFSSVSRRVILDTLRKDTNPLTGEPFFPAAICSRFATGNVVMFNHMTANILYDIAKREMAKSAARFTENFGVEVEIEPEVYTSLLLSEGGDVDARTICARAENFFDTEIFELLRLLSDEEDSRQISDLSKIKIGADLEGVNLEIKSLFKSVLPQEALVFGSSEILKLCETSSEELQFTKADSLDQSAIVLEQKDIDVIFADIGFGLKGEKNYLNLEDIDSDARDFLHMVRDLYPEIPVYLLVGEQRAVTQEEQVSFLRQGIRGLINTADAKAFKAELESIAVINHQQKAMQTLVRASKIVKYETAQQIDGSEAHIVLFDHKMSVAVNAEDANSVLSGAYKPNVKFEDVIGCDSAIKELRFFVKYLQNPKAYADTKMRAPRGVILYGPPGTGKTMLAKAMAKESDVTFIPVEGSSFLKRYAGEGPAMVKDIFARARKYAPAILFIDEIDAIAKQRTGEDKSGMEEIINQFLNEMDGFNTNPKKPVFVLAATNFDVNPGSQKSLDEAFMRRFDRKIFVDIPDKEARIKYIKLKLAKNEKLFNVSDELIDNIAIRSTGRSLADLENVFEMALRNAIIEEKGAVDDDFFEEAFETYIGGESKQWDEKLLTRVARHEAGHSFLYWEAGKTPAYVTIVARGNHGGYMLHDGERSFLSTREELKADIRTSMGGRAAEIVYYGEEDGFSTGASGDLENATAQAQRMICTYGMLEEIGLSSIKKEEIVSSGMYEKIHDMTNAILAEQLQLAIEIISKNKKAIDALVDVLLVKNHLTGEEINRIFTEATKQ